MANKKNPDNFSTHCGNNKSTDQSQSKAMKHEIWYEIYADLVLKQINVCMKKNLIL